MNDENKKETINQNRHFGATSKTAFLILALGVLLFGAAEFYRQFVYMPHQKQINNRKEADKQEATKNCNSAALAETEKHPYIRKYTDDYQQMYSSIYEKCLRERGF